MAISSNFCFSWIVETIESKRLPMTIGTRASMLDQYWCSISIFMNDIIAVDDPSMTPCYLNWACGYFMINLMMRSKAWSQAWPHQMANAHWIPRLSIIITSRWDHLSIPAWPRHQPVPVVTIDPHGHGRSVTITVDFGTVQGEVMADPLAQPYSERTLWRHDFSLDC